MARKFLTAIDLNKNELQNAVVQNLAGAPSSPVKGQLYFDSTGGVNILYWYNGTGWVAAQGGAGAVPATTVTTQAVGDSPVVGVATTYAREDHKHGREAFGAATADLAFGSAKVDGTAVTVAHSDHTHGNPTHDDAAHSAIHLNALAQPNASVNFGGQLATNLASPVGNTDGATKLYVDAAIAGLSWHSACRVATTTTGTLATAFANGQTVDGVVLATGDRILIKDQATGAENGIYVVTAGAPTRATDADTGPELLNAAVWVSEGTANHDTQWVCNNLGSITLGTTTVTFVQYNGASTANAGGGLTATGNVYAVGAGTGITVNADDVALTVPVTVPLGGTGRITGGTAYGLIAAGTTANGVQQTVAPAASGFLKTTSATALPAFSAIAESDVTNLTTDLAAKAGKFSQATIGGATSQVVTHNLGTQAVIVNVFRTLTPWETVECDVERTTINTVTLRFAVAPTTNEFTCVVVG